MKFHIVNCSGCDRKCSKSLPITFDVKAWVLRMNKLDCQEPDKKAEKIPLKLKHSSFDVKQNDKCPCGSEKKFKKCCMRKII